MKIPKLSFLRILQKKKKNEYYLSLVLRDEKASAVVFNEVENRVSVVGEHNEPFKTSLDSASEEELLNVLDRAVSIAEKNLPEGEESQKTIFGVKQDWVIDGKIKPEFLSKLKKVSDELQFKPVGFLVITEAIAHLLQKEEGAPISAILTEIGHKHITVSIIKASKVLETKSTPISEHISHSVDTLLKHFTVAEVLPPRIILFDGGNEQLQQEFIAHKWSHELGFMHIPQITNLPANFDARAVLNGAASQMGFEVLTASLVKAEKEDGEEAEILGDEPFEESDKTLEEAANEFGFTEKDIAEKPKTAIDESVDQKFDSDNLTIADQFKEIPEESKIENSDRRALGVSGVAMGASMKGFFGKIHLGNTFKKGSSRKKLLILAIPIILVIGIFIYYIAGRNATVTLGVNSENIEKTESITFSKDSKTNPSENILNAQFLESSQDGKVTTNTTGKKDTGEKAKGTVTMFNSSSTGKTIAAGTIITSSNDLRFVTDKAITVASASGDLEGTQNGKADVTITAEKFGTNYNLPSDTKFKVEGTSEIAAKNDKALAGGTKKEIKVVSQKDLDKLVKDLQTKLEEEAKNEINNKTDSDTVVLPNFASVKFDRKSFSKKVDEEANEVSLTGTINFEAVSYKKKELVDFAKAKLSESIPDNMTMDPERIMAKASGISQKNGETSAKVTITAAMIPKIDPAKIAGEIAGQSVKSATAKLQNIPNVEKVNIKIFIDIPLLPHRLPFSSNKIKVEVDKNG
jgi:hypothetical protein